jgi:hypothetical protein
MIITCFGVRESKWARDDPAFLLALDSRYLPRTIKVTTDAPTSE